MTPFELLYYVGYLAHKRYASSLRKELPCKVISIGNITMGGTGKTPAAVATAEEARKRGYRPVVLTRGYKGSAKGPCFVAARESEPLPGAKNSICSRVEEAGDEPMLMARRLRDVPIVKCADRYAGGTFALEALPSGSAPFLFILDDGFQHWKLRRDVDVVLIDGLNPYGNRRMPPLGPLREPLSALTRADVCVVTKSPNRKLKDEIAEITPGTPIYSAEYEAREFRDGSGRIMSADDVKTRKVYAFCGIANPGSFSKTLEALGLRTGGIHAYRDHHAYTEADITRLREEAAKAGCDFLVTTEKDMVKLGSMGIPDNLLYLEVGWKVEAGFFDTVFGRLEK